MSFFLKIAPVPALAVSLWLGLNAGCIASPGDPDGVGFAAQRLVTTCLTVTDGQETLPNYHCGNPADAGASATTTAAPATGVSSLGYYYGDSYPYGSYYGSYYGSPYGSYGYGYPVGSYGALGDYGVYGAYGIYGAYGTYGDYESGPDEPGYAPGDVGPPGNCGCGGAPN